MQRVACKGMHLPIPPDMACAERAKSMDFARNMNICNRAAVLSKKCHNKGKGRKGAGVATASTGVDAKAYMLVKLPSFRESHIKVMAAG